MSIVYVKEIAAGRDGEIDERAVRRYRRRWLVKMDNPTQGPLAATNTSALPTLYTHYRSVLGGNLEFDLGSTLRRLHPTQRPDDAYLWEVEGEYSSEIIQHRYDPIANWSQGSGGSGSTEQGSADENNPTLRQPEIEWDTFSVQRAMYFDLLGKAAVAANGERFDPPVEIQIDGASVDITRNEANFSSNLATEYINTLNGDTFGGGYQYHEARMARFAGKWRYERDFGGYWQVHYRIEFLPRFVGSWALFEGRQLTPWDTMILNHGSYYISGGEKYDFISKTAGLLSGGPLKADGDKLPVGGTPNYIILETRYTKNFAPLGLPI